MPNPKSKSVRIRRWLKREFIRVEAICPYCKTQMTMDKDQRNSATFDHIISKKQGGRENVANRQIMCAECNTRKGSHSNEYFVKYRLWEMPRGANFTLLNTQRHASITGDVACMRNMGKVCLAKNI